MGYWPVVQDLIENSDIVVLVADARMPELSLNKELVKNHIFCKGKRSALELF